MSFKYIYLPIGVPTFDLEKARDEFEKSKKLLLSINDRAIIPDDLLLSTGSLKEFIKEKRPSLAVVQNITFANGEYMAQIAKQFDCPVLLWTLKEPAPGGRLHLNSLTGAFSAANVVKNLGIPFEYVYGSPDDKNTAKQIKSAIDAARLKQAFRELNVLQIGHTPEGFGFGRALDLDAARVFGCNLISTEARELIEKAKAVGDDEAEEYLKKAKSVTRGLEKTNAKNALDFARLYKAYSDYVKENNIGALSSRCWPDFFTSYGTPVCAVLGMINDLGVAAACEADTYGAMSMYAARFLTGKPSFFGDPVALDEDENTITFWHCGTAAPSLARDDTGAEIGVHCNRKIGPTFEFGCAPSEKATVFRIGRDENGKFRLFIARGSVLDRPKQYLGTSLVFKTKGNAKNIVTKAVKAGFEPHFAIAMGDIAGTLKTLAAFLNLEAVCFD